MRFLEWVLTLYNQCSYTGGNFQQRNILSEDYREKMKVGCSGSFTSQGSSKISRKLTFFLLILQLFGETKSFHSERLRSHNHYVYCKFQQSEKDDSQIVSKQNMFLMNSRNCHIASFHRLLNVWHCSKWNQL